MNQTVSVAMMGMREWDNEFIANCLESTKKLRDELVFIDTQSCQNFPSDLLNSHKAKVYQYPWSDFSTGRNQSIKHSSKDWVFMIDCDEELKGDSDAFKKFLNGLPPEVTAITIPLKDIQKDEIVLSFLAPRVFRRGNIKFQGIVHNEPVVTGKVISFYDVCIHHYGYSGDVEKKREKIKYTESLLLKRVEENPNDYKAYFYLMENTISQGNVQEGLEYAKKYISHRKDIGQTFNNSIYATSVDCACALKIYDDALNILNEGLSLIPDDLDLNYSGVMLGASINHIDMVLSCGDKFLSTFKSFSENSLTERFTYRFNRDSYCYVLAQIGAIYLQKGKNKFKEIKRVTESEKIPVLEQELTEIFKKIGVTCAV